MSNPSDVVAIEEMGHYLPRAQHIIQAPTTPLISGLNINMHRAFALREHAHYMHKGKMTPVLDKATGDLVLYRLFLPLAPVRDKGHRARVDYIRECTLGEFSRREIYAVALHFYMMANGL